MQRDASDKSTPWMNNTAGYLVVAFAFVVAFVTLVEQLELYFCAPLNVIDVPYAGRIPA